MVFKKRFIFGLILAVSLLGGTVFQARAVEMPETCPTSSPASYFLKGRVMYWMQAGPTPQSIVSPAEGVVIEARRISTDSAVGGRYECTIGRTGAYSMTVEPGRYVVRPLGGVSGVRWFPMMKTKIVDGQQDGGVNFLGKLPALLE